MNNSDERAKVLNEAISIGDEVRHMIESSTWQKYIEPLFDAMIGDVLGRKINGRWENGALTDKQLSESQLRELQAYKAGMVAIHQGIHQLVDDADMARREIAQTQKLAEELVEGSYYQDEGGY